MNKRIEYANIPKRFSGASINDFDDDVVKTCRDFLASESWACLMVLGSVGSGKTHLACGIASKYCETANALFTTAYGMSQKIISDMKNSAPLRPYESRGIDFFAGQPLLIIDEITRTFDTAAERQRFFEVINYRYENLLPVVILGNGKPEDIFKTLGEAVSDRLKENLTVLKLTGKSRR